MEETATGRRMQRGKKLMLLLFIYNAKLNII